MTISLPLTALMILVAAAAGLVGFLYRKVGEQREKATLLAAALGTIAGICYRLERGHATRVDSRTDDSAWPLDLSALLFTLADDERRAVDDRLRALSASGAGFFHRTTARTARIFEISGHRLTATRGKGALDLVWVTDVTEREAASAARTRTESSLAFFRELLDRLPMPVWWRNDDLSLGGGNHRFALVEGLGSFSRDLAAGARDTVQPARARYEVAVTDGRRVYDVVELARETGGTIGFALERSEADQLQTEMDRIVLGHQQVLEAVGAAIAIWGPDTRLLFNNSAFARLWGLDQDWLTTEPSLGEVLDELRQLRALPEYADFRQFKAERAAWFTTLDQRQEELLYLPDERTLRLIATRHPFGGLTFTYEDVTDRLALERSYNTLAEVQRETLDSLFEGIAVFGSDGRLKLWNPAYRAMWSLTDADLAGRPHVAALVDKSRMLIDTGEDWEAMRSAHIAHVTANISSAERIERHDGSVLELNTAPLPDGNVLLIYLDVTDTLQLQRALRDQSDALETATRLKSEFIANVSYELRTPLNAIIGFAEILTNRYFGPLNDRQADYSRGILDSSQRLLSLINDIIDLATIEAGQLTITREPVDVHTLLASILTLTRERARRLELALGFDCPTDIGIVMMDERRIRQALFNLVSNAMKFTPAHGSVMLSAKRDGDEVALIVSDTGIGIEPEHQAQVFEKFERGDPSNRAAGAGLGLPLVKSLIQLHGGRVELDSSPGRGTRVTCFLPAGSRPAAEPELAARTKPATPRPRRRNAGQA